MRKASYKKDPDLIFMKKAILEARKALIRGEVPIGAVLVKESRMVARAHNCPISTSDPTAHAEILALRKAARKFGNYRLPGLTLYVTVEPCPMCLGAIIQARVKRVVFGTADPKAGAVFSALRFDLMKSNHRPEFRSGVLEEDCRELLKNFFRTKRGSKKHTG